MDMIQELGIDSLLEESAGKGIKNALETISFVQRNLFALAESEDSRQLDLLKIGTVFQVFLIDTLASGKRPSELTDEDWKDIADNVSQYAVLEKGQRYSEFVFSLYANYIDISVLALNGFKPLPEEYERSEQIQGDNCEKKEDNHYDNTIRLVQIKALTDEIRESSSLLQGNDEREVEYIEKCLSYWLTAKLAKVTGAEYAQLAQAGVDLAFEYGRYVLYAKEQAILDAYIQNQYVLDEELRAQYEEFLAELNENAAQFRSLIDSAFSPDIRNSLMQSAALARAAGVREEEILKSIDDIDSFFLD